jgi:hypothetical protein
MHYVVVLNRMVLTVVALMAIVRRLLLSVVTIVIVAPRG